MPSRRSPFISAKKDRILRLKTLPDTSTPHQKRSKPLRNTGRHTGQLQARHCGPNDPGAKPLPTQRP
ncbi:hypothetical protein BKA80DRAFT_282167 [Phyllosticta citrichinensis]